MEIILFLVIQLYYYHTSFILTTKITVRILDEFKIFVTKIYKQDIIHLI